MHNTVTKILENKEMAKEFETEPMELFRAVNTKEPEHVKTLGTVMGPLNGGSS